MTSGELERLPKGPHGLTRNQVRASQRERILDAVLDTVGARGYTAVTVADITTAAGISRTTFYELFDNKREAFLTAYEQFGRQFMAELSSVPPTAPVEAIDVAAERLVDIGRTRPDACRAFLVEILAVGPEGLEHRDRVMNLAVEQFDLVAAWMRSVDPSLPAPRRLVGRAVVAASWELTALSVRSPDDTHAETREALAYIWLLGLTGTPALAPAPR